MTRKETFSIRQTVVALVLLLLLAAAANVASIFGPRLIQLNRDRSDAVSMPEEGIAITHSFSDGTHRYSGAVALPTPCHTLSTQAVVLESYPEQVQIRITVEPPLEGVVCAQTVTEAPFSVAVSASRSAQLTLITVDNTPQEFHLTESSL